MKPVNQIRFVAFVAAAATLFGGCEKESDNTVDAAPVAARITSTIDAMETRAANTSWAEGDAIGITTTYMNGVKYTNIKYHTTTTTGGFTPAGSTPHDTIYFQNKENVTFTAYYPYDGTNGTAPGTNADGILTKTITAAGQTAAGQTEFDFLFATATGSSTSPNVEFRFRHCMSRLVLNFLPGNGITSLCDLEYTISNLAFQGTFDTGTGETQMTEAGSLTLSVPYDASAMYSTLIVFPQQAFSADIRIAMNNADYTGTIDFPENPANSNVHEFAPGHSYTYNITVHDTELTIKLADIKDWEDEDTPIDGGAFLE